MRRNLTPCAVTRDKIHLPLNRIEFTDRQVAEAFLQEALSKNPGLLPVDEIDPAFSPVASLGREIAGTDNLFISPLGRLTLVETKLWRNPESGREVVGQLLDYATALTAWSYEELETRAREADQSPLAHGETLPQYVARLFPDEVLPEARFIDAVTRSLRWGRMMLLIVGDGIREGVERMLGYLHDHPQQHFTFGLVELGIYETPDVFPGRILIPSRPKPRKWCVPWCVWKPVARRMSPWLPPGTNRPDTDTASCRKRCFYRNCPTRPRANCINGCLTWRTTGSGQDLALQQRVPATPRPDRYPL